MGAEVFAVGTDEAALQGKEAACGDIGGIVAVRNEADLLAVRRIRAGKLRGRGHLADIRLFKLADRQAQAGQNILGQPIQLSLIHI